MGISCYIVQLKEGITLTAKLRTDKFTELVHNNISAKRKKQSDTKWKEAGL